VRRHPESTEREGLNAAFRPAALIFDIPVIFDNLVKLDKCVNIHPRAGLMQGFLHAFG
jgi:hypothetical protein